MLFLTLVSALSLASLGSSSPTGQADRRTSYPVGIVTPGPGFPSLKDLNLTNEDLYDPDFLTKRAIVTKPLQSTGTAKRQAQSYCWGDPRDRLRAADWWAVMGCANYLSYLGQTTCAALQSGTTMCSGTTWHSGLGARITGWALCNVIDASWCQDVAYVPNWILQKCDVVDPDLDVLEAYGAGAAWGNGCLQIVVTGL